MILVAGAFLGGWALLSVLATERLRLLSELEARKPRPLPATPSTPPKPPAAPSKAKPRAEGDSKSASKSKSKSPAGKRPPAADANAR